MMPLCCPYCRHAFPTGAAPELPCAGCARRFPVLLGIPDLRVAEGPYISNADDRAKAAKLAEAARTSSFAELVSLYYRLTPEVPEQDARRYAHALRTAASRATDTLASWSALAGRELARGACLVEVGCGTGALLAEAARHGALPLGIDVSLRWLVIARKRLDEAGLAIPLVCANAEALPLPDQAADCLAFDSALEHFRDAPLALREAARVLAPGGALWVATPNRWSLGPDPHLGVWAGGFWPDSLTRRLAARRGALAPVRRLVGAAMLRRWLDDAGFGAIRLGLPAVSAAQRAGLAPAGRVLAGAYNRVRGLAAARAVLLRVGPVLHATAVGGGIRR